MNRNTALLNGAILWATTLALSAWLLASGVSGAFGIAASNAGEVFNQVQQQGGVNVPNNAPNVTADQTRDIAGNAAKGLWSFVLGSLLGLAASLGGASAGVRKPHVHRVN
jgi:enterochelin esterase-like enzyme